MSTELVERLRAGVPLTEVDGREVADTDAADATMEAAADELTALTAKVALLTEALRQARIWHESEDKSLSKQQPSHGPTGNQWARLQHQEQMAEIDAALSEPDKEGT